MEHEWYFVKIKKIQHINFTLVKFTGGGGAVHMSKLSQRLASVASPLLYLQVFCTPFVGLLFLCFSFALLFEEFAFVAIGTIDAIPTVTWTNVEAIGWEVAFVCWFFCKTIARTIEKSKYIYFTKEKNTRKEIKLKQIIFLQSFLGI